MLRIDLILSCFNKLFGSVLSFNDARTNNMVDIPRILLQETDSQPQILKIKHITKSYSQLQLLMFLVAIIHRQNLLGNPNCETIWRPGLQMYENIKMHMPRQLSLYELWRSLNIQVILLLSELNYSRYLLVFTHQYFSSNSYDLKQSMAVAKMLLLILLLLLNLPSIHTQTFTNYNYFLGLMPYNQQYSLKAAVYSSLAYCDNQCVTQWECGSAQNYPQLQNVVSFENIKLEIKAYIGYSREDNKIVVAFRGTKGLKSVANWLSNLDAFKEKYAYCQNCQIHSGFSKSYQSVSKTLYQYFEEHMIANPSAQVLATGHSLGGALAIIAGIQLRRLYGVKVQIHTFGSPRVGNAALAAYINQNIDDIYRVVHNRDIVPHVPPMSSGYRHAAYEIFWNQQFTKYRVCADGQDSGCSNNFKYYSVADHGLYFVEISRPVC